MSLSEFTVRITAEGRIVFDLSGLTPEQIRLHREMAEQMLGPIVAEGTPADPPDPGHVSAAASDAQSERMRGHG